MNPVGLGSTHQSSSSSNPSSKTVAAILKQQKEFKVGENMSAPRSQHLQQQFQRKGLSHKNIPPSSSGLQDNLNFGKSVNSPKNLGHGGSSTPASISPAMSPSNAQVVSPSGREPNHSATTKSSSLSRELSPSRITAQIVKVMADTSQSSTQNLLLSVLQGNMPDPMGILNSSKPDTSSSTIGVSSASVSNRTISPAPRISHGGKNNTSANTLSSTQHNSFIPASSPMYDSGGGMFLAQISNLEERASPSDAFSSLQQVHGSSVSNLLTASAGSVQTVNVSHIPKTTNIPLGMNPGGLLSSGHSLSSSSPRHSPRSAMEVAQQIKLEANGQSASAHRAAMQQQLRSQIKGSRSLDAQLASSRQNVGGNLSTGPSDQQQPFNNSHQILPIKEMEQQKTLEASMPLLASKLSSVPSSPNVNSNTGLLQQNSKMKQNLPLTASLLKSPLSSSTNPSTLHNFSVVNPSTLSSPLAIRKPVHQSVSSQLKSVNSADPKQQHRQQQLQKQLQQQQQQQQQQQLSSPGLSSSSVQSSLESAESLWQQQQTLKSPSYVPMSVTSASSSVGKVGLLDQNKQPMLQRLIQASDSSSVSEHTVQTDIVMKAEGQAQTANPTMSKHLRVGVNSNATGLNSFPGLSNSNKGKMSQSIQAVGIGGLGQTLHSGSLPKSSVIEKRRKSGPGESKQTAIDVDMDFGNLPSIAGDDQSNAITNISHNVQFSSLSPGENDTMPLLLGQGIGNVFQQPQPQLQQHDIKLANATFVKDITGVSNPSGSGGDISSFLPINSSASPLQTNFSKTTRASGVQSSQSVVQTSKPISYPYLSTAATNVSTTAIALPNFLSSGDFMNPAPPPPPPYPANKSTHSYLQQNQNAILLQQQQQQQQQLQSQQIQQQQQQPSTTKSSAKYSVRNPFTFPTTGVKVQAGHDSAGLLSYTISPHPQEISADKKVVVKSEPTVASSVKDKYPGVLGKSQSDVSYLSSANPHLLLGDTKPEMPRLVPQTSFKFEERNQTIGAVVKTEDVPTSDEQSMVQPFNQRVANLSCLPVTNTVYRASYRTHAIAVQRARSGVITNTAKTLDVLRQNIQRSVNKEISEIIKKYTNKFFEPALANIRQNSNEDLLGKEHLNHVCRQILEEAKSEYSSSLGRRSVTPTTDMFDNISDSGSASGRRMNLKRSRISDSDSEKGSEAGSVRRTIKRKGRPPVHGSGRVTPSKTLKAGDLIRKEGSKWDPDRIKSDTLLIMGAKANKALGLGNTRGRLYIRHPDIFKYVGDTEDKQWLCERNLMPPTGGKAYLMLVEDIEDLSRSDDYRDSPCLLMHECKGFNVPEWMLVKMKEQMAAQRTDGHRKTQLNCDAQPENPTNNRPKTLPFSTFTDVSIKVETQPSPADTEDMEFLSTIDVDDNRPSSTISPFTMTGGFEEAGAGSLSPADLDAMDDRPVVSSIFT